MVSPAQSRLIQAQLAPAALASQISSALAAKSLDAEKQAGAAVLRLLDGATQTQSPSQDNGLGGQLDITA
ncbi:MAG TPA: hypothetical protein VHM90_22190 [Phycisphaerae bacterium]|jgi:hypothetical protein|nr:hypothetical protein [Phycisphaerae bacterium]